MTDIAKKLVLFTILISGTQVIQLPFGNLSLFKISIFITIFVGIIAFFEKREIRKGIYLPFVFLYGISSIFAWSISTNPSWANSYLLLGLMTAAFVFLISNLFDYKDIDLLEKTIIQSQYIVFPFSIYSVYMFYFRGGLPSVVNLFAGLTITLDEDTLLRGQASSQIRLMLPYATPPVLSVAMAMCVILLITNKNLYNSFSRYFLIVAYGTVLVMTASRTGILGLVLGLVIFFSWKWYCRNSDNIKLQHILSAVAGIIILPIAFFILFPNLQNVDYLSKMITRFMGFDFIQDRHFLVPLDGVLIWVDSLENFIFGIGTGSSINIVGAHTYLPPYFLNSFVTLVAERGFLGLCIIMLFVALTRSLLHKANINKDVTSESVAFCLLTGLLSCFFYEALNCYTLVFVLAISFLADQYVIKTKII